MIAGFIGKVRWEYEKAFRHAEEAAAAGDHRTEQAHHERARALRDVLLWAGYPPLEKK